MASYPTTAKTFVSRSDGQVISATHVGDLQDEVAAIEDGLLNGTARLNSSNSTVAALSVSGASTFAGTANFAGTVQFAGSAISGAWTAWTPTMAGFSGSPTVTLARYLQIGKTVFVTLDISGTSNANTFTYTLPVAPKSTLSTMLGAALDNSAAVSTTPRADWTAASTTVTLYAAFVGTAWTTSGTKGYRATFTYEAA